MGIDDYSQATIQAVTRAVRKADEEFERSGGSSRHWVIECFLPELANEDLKVQSYCPEVSELVLRANNMPCKVCGKLPERRRGNIIHTCGEGESWHPTSAEWISRNEVGFKRDHIQIEAHPIDHSLFGSIPVRFNEKVPTCPECESQKTFVLFTPGQRARACCMDCSHAWHVQWILPELL